MVGEIADTSSGIDAFTRVDLVWQFRHDPASLIRAHRNCIFPRCSRPKHDFSELSASWDYAGKRIIMYDKQNEMCGGRGDIVRVEIQLSKEPLKKHLGDENGIVSELCFVQSYRTFRFFRQDKG